MESDSRVDWLGPSKRAVHGVSRLQMALMQAAEGKLKAAALYEVSRSASSVVARLRS